ncbi:hypothetical protein [Meiothermus sp.]|uniref:hypothetical protein n=1 Tax=Meiothermus sp. TaxID=1955249 RepID=UPI0021DE6209|nr:hypothetical protein [Meiothermus sp.]GIW33194.1 MAG: hypothetical protein KatS3mg072_0527 [Meiothermus sp.]
MRPVVILLAVGLLLGCSKAPLSVPLRDFDIDVAAIQSGKIAFVKQGFEKPPVGLTRASLEGSLTYKTGVSFTFYAADTEPCTTQINGLYLCDQNPAIEEIGMANFTSSPTQPLLLSGNKLTNGINTGDLWIGIKLESGLFTAGTLQFRNMVAKIAVLP